MTLLQLFLGLVFLFIGAELLIRAGTGLAASLKLSPLVIGLTLVAYGTGLPELLVSVQGAWNGAVELSLGNVVGSNIFNILLILGVSSQIVPLVVSQKLLRTEVPLLIGISLLVYGLAYNGILGPWDGFYLLTGLMLYTVWVIIQSRKTTRAVKREYEREIRKALDVKLFQRSWFQGLMVPVSLTMLVLGSRWFTGAAVSLARLTGLSEWVIGITIVSAGTSLPEVGTSVMAAARGERDIAVGNVIGSNLFNLTGVLGLSCAVSGGGLSVSPTVLAFDLPVMITVTIACLPIFFSGHRISRGEGLLFIGYYIAYITVLLWTPTYGYPSLLLTVLLMLPLVVVTTLTVRGRK